MRPGRDARGLGVALPALALLGALAPIAVAAPGWAQGGEARERAAPATAESGSIVTGWIVTADGERIETRGPWRVEGSRVLYVAQNGVLVSLRVEQVDLEASRALEAEVEAAAAAGPQPPPRPAEPARPPRLVLTEKELPPITGAGSSAPAGSEPGADDSRPAEAQPAERAAGGSDELTIVDWRNVAASGAPIQIYGTLRNDARGRRSGLTVTVKVFDEGGNELASQPALLQDATLEAGRSTSFRIFFPEIERYERVEIVASHG
ncbi:MAG TPA: hypothetical protein VMV46_00450 [Thermoanaerobaculia bacterium]|nr:hypothetical protein [Thermoanaerobaculia bacterium]